MIEQLTYAALGGRLQISPEAARALVRRLRLPRQCGNDGKVLVAVDIAEITHNPMPSRSPPGHRAVADALKAQITELEDELAKMEMVAGGHRADFERERDRADRLMSEMLKATGELMAAKETTARLEGELAAVVRARPWWHRLAGRY
jgi:hypothetical protein